MNTPIHRTFIPVRRAAGPLGVPLGVPLAWLRQEVKARRVPAIRAGSRWYVHLDAAQAALSERAKREGVSHES